jgi:hypothetical protein
MKPEKLNLYIGGYFGTSYGVEFERGALLYTCWGDQSDQGEKHRIKPSPDAWTTFWRRLDEVGFGSWSGSYQPPSIILDGTGWSAEIAAGERSVEAHGSNAYPPCDPKAASSREPCEPGSRFDKFCEAVSELLGGREFG